MKYYGITIDIERIVLTDLDIGPLAPQELHWRIESELEKELHFFDFQETIINKGVDKVQSPGIEKRDAQDSSMLASIVAKRISSAISEEVFEHDHNQ